LEGRLGYNVAMLQLSGTLVNKPVLSLQTSSQIALAVGFLIDPTSLKIIGLQCKDNFGGQNKILLAQDVRDILAQGYVVNDLHALTDPKDLVKFKDLIDLNFQLTGKTVVTDSKKRLGKVSDFAVEKETLYIQKFYVEQSLIKSLSGGQLSVDRNQIVEITPKKIIIQDPQQPLQDQAPAPAAAA
jgi:sporulation protein YlmC with PRC-barrel domain